MTYRNVTHSTRWQGEETHRDAWSERNKLMFDMFLEAEFEDHKTYRVSEFGCGPNAPFEAVCRDHPGFSVRKYDLKQWDDTVTPVNLNMDASGIAPAEICVLSGVLEYINDVPGVLRQLFETHPYLLVSYAFVPLEFLSDDASYLKCIKSRAMFNGWRNHYTNKDVVDVLSRFGVISSISGWKRQSLFVVRRFEAETL